MRELGRPVFARPRFQDAVPEEQILRCHVETEEVPEELLELAYGWRLKSGRPIAHVTAHLRVNSEVLRKRERRGRLMLG